MSLKGRIALVTGGSRGIGREISLALAEDGATIAVNYRRDEDAAAETVKMIEDMGGTARAYGASVNDGEAVRAMVAKIESDLGPVSILVNNAGIASRGNTVFDTDPAELERVLSVHAMGPFLVSQAVLEGMRSCERGDIIEISSVATKLHAAHSAPYTMGKVAGEALALALAKEERKHNIYVNIVNPGLVYTDMGARLAKATVGTDNVDELDKQYPFGHVCRPHEIANVVRFLVGPLNTYVTGQKIHVDGGGPDPRY